MGDDDNICQPSKKRAAGVQLSRDNPGLDDDNEETSEQEAGTFKRASEEVLATRKIVKVRRQHTSSTLSAADPPPSSNPFGAIRLVPPGSAPSVQVEASDFTSQVTKGIDANDNKGKSVADETKEGGTGADFELSEREVIDSKLELNSEKDEPVIPGEESITKYVQGKVVKGENSGDGAGEATEVAGDEDARKDIGDKKNDEEKGDGEKDEPVIPGEESITKYDQGKVVERENFGDGAGEGTEVASDEDARKDIGDKKNDEEKGDGVATIENKAETASINSFQQLSSSQNAFSGLAQTGSSTTSFAFGSTPQDRPLMGSTSGTLSMPEVPVETGEENEKAVFTSNSVLYEFVDDCWKERGKGELKLNVPTSGTGKARLVMRARGNYRLILNASLFPEIKLTNMEKKGITFACVNSASEGKDCLSTIALKFKDASVVEDFQAAVMQHKTNPDATLKTPENSPQRSAK